VRDDASNVDGLPNFALEALASAARRRLEGGRPATDDRRRRHRAARPERDPPALASAIGAIIDRPDWGGA
jgi:hypothetical protein